MLGGRRTSCANRSLRRRGHGPPRAWDTTPRAASPPPSSPRSPLPMSQFSPLLRRAPAARRFFAVHLQSSLGTGMGYVALVLVALERFHSSWAVAVVLLADVLPLMLLGPLLGGIADRLPRRPCAVAADVVRAVAFLGIAFAGQLWLVVVLAALAGAGNGVFR